MSKYPWYKVISSNESLEQGDFVFDCPILLPLKTKNYNSSITEKTSIEIEEYDVIILSQSCDLSQRKLELVLVSPIWNWEEFQMSNDFFKSKKGKENLRKGNPPGYHLINKCQESNFESGFQVVDFRKVFSISFMFLENFTKKSSERKRLLPPYREHLSQAFARFFMRVGLPIDIENF